MHAHLWNDKHLDDQVQILPVPILRIVLPHLTLKVTCNNIYTVYKSKRNDAQGYEHQHHKTI